MTIDPSNLPYRPCVGVMVFNRAGKVFVGRRAGNTDKNEGRGHWWQMPQGGIDEGESRQIAGQPRCGVEIKVADRRQGFSRVCLESARRGAGTRSDAYA